MEREATHGNARRGFRGWKSENHERPFASSRDGSCHPFRPLYWRPVWQPRCPRRRNP